MSEKKPLVSFCLMACRQKELIREAFQAALLQDYDNLEICVSDDNSQDGTWEIIQEMARAYKGPHRLVLNHNESNLGTIGNWQKLCSMATGELFIKADGDDVSYPHRARTIAEDWVSSGRRAAVMASSYDKMTAEGKIVGEFTLPGGWDERTTQEIVNGAHYFYLGGTFACHRSLFDDFMTVTHLKSSDCAAFEARGLLCRMALDADGKIFHPFRTISDKLVKYRVGTGDTTGGAYRKFMAKGIRRSLEARLQALEDLQHTAKVYLPEEYGHELEELYKSSVEHLEKVIALWDGDKFSERLVAYHALPGGGTKLRLIQLLLLLPKGFSNFIFSMIR